jgi:dTDP-4-amino-4,6-dideoxygalactose transaminase
MTEAQIPVAKPKLPRLHEITRYLEFIDHNRIYSNRGPLLRKYEVALANFLRVDPDRVVLTANATIALEACVQISSPMEWVVPDFTFSATGSAVLRAGKRLYLADVDIKDWSLDCNTKSVKSVDKNTTGILPVMPFGSAIEFAKWADFKHVVIDAAASIGTENPNFDEMPRDWFVVYSLHATKIFPTAEGGLVIAQNAQSANKLRKWINFGFSEERISESMGSNGKMSEYHAAIGLVSIENNAAETSDWSTSLEYVKKLNKFSSIISQMNGIRPYWIVEFPNTKTKLDCQKELSSHGIASRSWWRLPLSEMGAFRGVPLLGKTHVSKQLSETTLGLPMFRDIKIEELSNIGVLL